MATLKRKLTVRVVKSIKLGTTDTFVWDTEILGFGLRVRIARQWAAEVQQGGDLGGERSEVAKALTIAQFADRYMAEHARPKKQPRSVSGLTKETSGTMCCRLLAPRRWPRSRLSASMLGPKKSEQGICGLKDFLYQRDRENITLVHPDLALMGTWRMPAATQRRDRKIRPGEPLRA